MVVAVAVADSRSVDDHGIVQQRAVRLADGLHLLQIGDAVAHGMVAETVEERLKQRIRVYLQDQLGDAVGSQSMARANVAMPARKAPIVLQGC